MPTDRQQTCKKQGCSNRFTRPQGTNRIYCFECSPEGKAKSNLRYFPGNGSKSVQNDPNSAENGENEGNLTRFSRETLEKWGVLETWQGAAAMALAALIDAGKHGASGAAGTIKAHREAMDVAMSIAESDEADVIEAIFGDGL